MPRLVEKLKEFGKYEVLNFAYSLVYAFATSTTTKDATREHFLKSKNSTPSEDLPKFILRWAVNIPEGIMASHYFYNGQVAKGISSIVIAEAVKYGLHKLLDEYIPQNQEIIVKFLEKHLGKKNPH